MINNPLKFRRPTDIALKPGKWFKVRFRKHLSLPDEPGVYAIKRGREILYIGMSGDLKARWSGKGDRRHGRYWLSSLVATHIAYFPTRDYEALEKRLIAKHSPPWNYKTYPAFWNSNRSWLGKLGAFVWLLARGDWRVVVDNGMLLIGVGLFLFALTRI